MDIPTLLKNIRDFFYFLAGTWQSRKLLKVINPDIIFIKGGFVGVPVGLAAAQLHIPYITHDSDAIPGLANRIISRWAKIHAVALPVEAYKYPADKTITTGIPLQDDFVPVTKTLKNKYRKELGISENSKVLFIIGGGLGSRTINNAATESIPHLLREFPGLVVLHATGRGNYSEVEDHYKNILSAPEQGRLKILSYIEDVYRYSGSADIVVTRAGATNLAEFALQAKACVIIPSPFLTGGHQLKNAEYLHQKNAARVLKEDEIVNDPLRLAKIISELFKDQKQCHILAEGLNKFAIPNATSKLAKIILTQK